jgi:hypothetical protein
MLKEKTCGFPSWPEALGASSRGRIHARNRTVRTIRAAALRTGLGPYMLPRYQATSWGCSARNDLPRKPKPTGSRVFGPRGPVKAGLTGGLIALISQVGTSSKTREPAVNGGPSFTSFSAPSFTSAEGGTKSCLDSGSEAGAWFAGQVVLARAELSAQVAANACGLRWSNALCGRT